MSLDDRILLLQRAIDRLVRRLRRGGAPQPTRRRFLIVQIDGLSRDVLDQGLRSGHMPFLKRLLRRHGYRRPWCARRALAVCGAWLGMSEEPAAHHHRTGESRAALGRQSGEETAGPALVHDQDWYLGLDARVLYFGCFP